MDFSDAEAKGFCMAFVQVFLEQGDPRSAEDLYEAAENLLRGCDVHYKDGVKRVSRISAVVAPEKRIHFQQQMNSLLTVKSLEEFNSRCDRILKLYPKCKDYLAWWRRPAHARKLFESSRTMDRTLWEGMPKTNNAEEAMHSRIYASIGKDQSLLEGLRRLVAFVRLFVILHDSARSTFSATTQLEVNT